MKRERGRISMQGMVRAPHRFHRRPDLADIGAVALLLLTAGLMMVAILRRLGGEPSEDTGRDGEDGP